MIEDSELRVAARSGALCMVVRTDKWRPRTEPNNHTRQSMLIQQEIDITPGAIELQEFPEQRRPAPLPVQGQAVENGELSEPPKWRVIEGYWCKELPWLWPFFDTSLERPEPYHAEAGGRSIWRTLFEGMTRMERKIHGTVVLPGNGHPREEP